MKKNEEALGILTCKGVQCLARVDKTQGWTRPNGGQDVIREVRSRPVHIAVSHLPGK